MNLCDLVENGEKGNANTVNWIACFSENYFGRISMPKKMMTNI